MKKNLTFNTIYELYGGLFFSDLSFLSVTLSYYMKLDSKRVLLFILDLTNRGPECAESNKIHEWFDDIILNTFLYKSKYQNSLNLNIKY